MFSVIFEYFANIDVISLEGGESFYQVKLNSENNLSLILST